jgi:hypothetical protein
MKRAAHLSIRSLSSCFLAIAVLVAILLTPIGVAQAGDSDGLGGYKFKAVDPGNEGIPSGDNTAVGSPLGSTVSGGQGSGPYVKHLSTRDGSGRIDFARVLIVLSRLMGSWAMRS